MQQVIKLRNGLIYTTDIGNDFSNIGNPNILQLIQNGKDNDADVNINDQHFKWHDVYSIEFIL